MVITQWPQEMFGIDSFLVSISTPFKTHSAKRIASIGQIVKTVEIVQVVQIVEAVEIVRIVEVVETVTAAHS
jgi:hypothetical protein